VCGVCVPNCPCAWLPVPSQQQQQQTRKVWRCWSTELHRQFVAAFNNLGGPPKMSLLANFGPPRCWYYIVACNIRNTKLELMSSFMACHVCSCHPKANQRADEGGWADQYDEVKSQHQVNILALSLIHVIKIHCRCLLCGLLTWILCFWCFFRNNGCTTGGRLDPVW
jgi:hypothetical protein